MVSQNSSVPGPWYAAPSYSLLFIRGLYIYPCCSLVVCNASLQEEILPHPLTSVWELLWLNEHKQNCRMLTVGLRTTAYENTSQIVAIHSDWISG